MSRPDPSAYRRLPLAIVVRWLTGQVITLREGVRCHRFAESCGLRLVPRISARLPRP